MWQRDLWPSPQAGSDGGLGKEKKTENAKREQADRTARKLLTLVLKTNQRNHEKKKNFAITFIRPVVLQLTEVFY